MATLPNPSLPWPIAIEAVNLIAAAESCRLRAYKCPAGVWTCGWGETDGVGPNTVWTQEFADQRFCDSLRERADAVAAACTVEPNENQLGAMVSLAYNIGMGWGGKTKPAGAKDGFRQSSVLRNHNAGNTDAAARAFGLWNKAGGQVLRGLTIRRAAEAALYLKPPADSVPEPMPQAVQAESSLKSSPIAQSGTVAAGVGVIGLANELGSQIAPIKSTLSTVKELLADTFGVPTNILPWLLVAVIGAVIVWQRMKQRKGGWA